MGFTVKAEVEGLEGLLGKLDRLKKAVRSRIMRKAVAAGAKLVNKSAKQLAPKGKRGLLRKSIGSKVKTYRGSGVVVGIVGPRKGFRAVVNGRPHDPVNYAHIVEFGRVSVVAKAKALSDGTVVYGRRVKAARAQPFLRPALENNRAAIIAAMSAAISAGLEAEAKR